MELEKLKEAIAEVLNVDPREITDQTTFMNDLGADSLDIYQIIVKVEESCKITLDADEVAKITTVAEAVELIKDCECNRN
ncbi:MAG: acyl carrier protein [Lachnospiraceae bacterium]|nr:acyl carrier protein [Lachnospiraceae bacterium]